jgi:hypothetical protein
LSNERPTAFVIQEPWPDRDTGESVRDFTPAETYGRLRFLLPPDRLPTDHLVEDLLAAGLEDWDPTDYLVCSGHPAAIGIATALVATRGPVQLLIWSGRRRGYDVITFSLPRVAAGV